MVTVVLNTSKSCHTLMHKVLKTACSKCNLFIHIFIYIYARGKLWIVCMLSLWKLIPLPLGGDRVFLMFVFFFMVKCLLRFEETAEVSSLCRLYGHLNILSQSLFVSCSGYFSQGYCSQGAYWSPQTWELVQQQSEVCVTCIYCSLPDENNLLVSSVD